MYGGQTKFRLRLLLFVVAASFLATLFLTKYPFWRSRLSAEDALWNESESIHSWGTNGTDQVEAEETPLPALGIFWSAPPVGATADPEVQQTTPLPEGVTELPQQQQLMLQQQQQQIEQLPQQPSGPQKPGLGRAEADMLNQVDSPPPPPADVTTGARKQQLAALQTFMASLEGSSAKTLKYMATEDMNQFRQSIPTDLRIANLDQMTEEQLAQTAHSVFDNANALCGRKLRMGDLNDGGWEVCDDPDVRLTPPCIVYSFGIGLDWSFDDVISRVYGCQVYSFDPDMNLAVHNRSSRIHFFNIGITGSSQGFLQSKISTRKLMTFEEIRAMLGHSDTPIDLVKMDVEGAEWQAIPNMMATNQLPGIKQILFEFHVHSVTRDYLLPRLKGVQDFEKLGYRKFHINKNFNCPTWVQGFPIQRTMCYEVHYVYRP